MIRRTRPVEGSGGYFIRCPGCENHHYIAVEKPLPNGAKWTFNGDLEKPTFSPSLLVRVPIFREGQPAGDRTRCHSFIRNGQIQYLSDCSHELASQTVDLPNVDED